MYCMHTHIYMYCMHTHARTHACTHARTHTHTHTHTHTGYRPILDAMKTFADRTGDASNCVDIEVSMERQRG